MASFSFKEITNPPSLGERLKASRESLDITLPQAANRTNISAKYLLALESGNYSQLPGEVYTKSFLRVYAKFLHLSPKDILALYQSEQKIYTNTRTGDINDLKKPVERVSRVNLLATPKLIRSLAVSALALTCLVYLGFKMQNMIAPPKLAVDKPINNLVTNDKFVQVAGQVEKETTLDINGQQASVDKNGNFAEVINLQAGVNNIEILAQKKHGQQLRVYRQVVVN